MSTLHDKASQFRALHVPGSPLVLFNCWDVGSARAIAAGGARAIATASWAVAAANGYADGEQLPFELAIGNLARIARAVDLPVTVDLESGYGADPVAVAASVQKAVEAGAVGCNLEDSDPASGTIRTPQNQAARLAAARAAASATCPAFFINARTDVFFIEKGWADDEARLADAIARAELYARNGADGLFVPGLTDKRLIERLVRAVPLPVNLMAGKSTPGMAELRELGVARLSYGPGAYRGAMAGLEEAARQAFGPALDR